MSTEPPNNWQLDKELSLLRQDMHGLQETQDRQGKSLDENGRILREVRDHMLARENQGRGIVWAAGVCGGLVAVVIGWAKTILWTGGHP